MPSAWIQLLRQRVLAFGERDSWLQNLIDNHDQIRTMVRLDKIGVTSENERERRMDLATTLLMTVRGIPIIYYGDEQYLADNTLFEQNGGTYNKASINSTAFSLVWLTGRIVGVMAEPLQALIYAQPPSDPWSTSRSLLERSRRSLAGGVSSPFRAKAPVPLFLADASGSMVTDVDGNRYIDYALAWGPLILGHRHPKLVAAIREQADRPHIYGAQHELEYQVAEMIQELVPCAERVAFTSSGSEAVQIVLRLARAFTRRRLIVKFEGHYHGWMDSVLLSYKPSADQLRHAEAFDGIPGSAGQVANAVDNVLVLPWNDAEKLEALLGSVARKLPPSSWSRFSATADALNRATII